MFLGLKGFNEAPYIWTGIIVILIALFVLDKPPAVAILIIAGTVIWIYGDKIHGCL